MLKASRQIAPDWYTPQSQVNDPTPTRFLLRPLTGLEQIDVRFERGDSGERFLTEAGARTALRRGLVNWENFLDHENRPLQFVVGDPDYNLARLDLGLVVELATEIYLRSVLTEEQRKNLSSPPMSAPTEKSSDAQPAAGGGTATNATPPVSPSGG
jgi:hypothetical protein